MTSSEREKGIYKVTLIGSGVNLALMLFKFAAGIAGNSAAMIADAVHSLSDFITDFVVIIFTKIAGKPSDDAHEYGHGKFETLATLVIGFVLLLVAIGIAWSGATSIIAVANGETLPPPATIALVAAILSIVLKELLYHYTIYCGRKLKSDTVIANAWHHRSDAFSSLATAFGIGGAILLGHKWTVLDPIAALLVSFFIARVAIKLTKPCIDELMEKSLPSEVEKEITAIVNSFEPQGVHLMHNLKTRKIGTNYAIEFHVRMQKDTPLIEAHEMATRIEASLKAKYGASTHVIIHMEPMRG